MSDDFSRDDAWLHDDEPFNGGEEAVYDDASTGLSAEEAWGDEYVDEGLDASFYDLPEPPIGDDAFDDGPYDGDGDWIRSNWWRILVVVILLLITLALLLRSCNGAKKKAAPTPFPTPAVTPLATFTPTPVVSSQSGGQATAPTAPVVEQPTQAPAPTPAPATGGKFSINQQVEVFNTGKDRLSFRAGPGGKYARLALLEDGTKLKVMGGPEKAEGRTWWRLQRSDGTIGWSIEDNLRPAQ